MVEELIKQGFHYVGTIRGNWLQGAPLVSETDLKKQGRGSMNSVYEKNREHRPGQMVWQQICNIDFFLCWIGTNHSSAALY